MIQQYKMLHELEQRFDQVVESCQQLIEVYQKNMGAAWALHSPTPDAEWLHQVLLDFWYADDQDGRARLHLKQCWRHLPISEQPLDRVRFAWYTSGRSIRKISVRDAEAMLLKLNTEAPHVQIQLRALAGIPSSEPLAQVQQQAPVMRGNLFYQEPLPDGRLRRAMNVALPLCVPSEDGHASL